MHQTLGAAAKIARELGHDYIGTEHQLLAIIRDSTLSDAVFPAEARERAGAYVRDVMASTKY